MAQVWVAKGSVLQREERALDPALFGGRAHADLLHEAVVNHLANRRQGTAATKSRGLVSGGGKKPWRQKGTGRARAGSNRSPLWVGGGTTFGPHPRDYAYQLPRKVRRAALRAALSAKARAGEIVLLEEWSPGEGKTRTLASHLKQWGLEGSILLLTEASDPRLLRAARNLPRMTILPARLAHAYALLSHRHLLVTPGALAVLKETFVA